MVTRNTVSEDEVLLEVRGALYGTPAIDFHATLESLVAGPCKSIVLDFSDLVSIGSSSIGRILLSRQKLAEQGRTIRIDGCSDGVYGTFRLLRFDRLVPVHRHPGNAQEESGLTR